MPIRLPYLVDHQIQFQRFRISACMRFVSRNRADLSHTDGSGYRAVYDLSDLDNSQFIIAPGQSGNFLSPHYADLLPRWRDGEYIRVAGTRDDVGNAAIGKLFLLPAGKSSNGTKRDR